MSTPLVPLWTERLRARGNRILAGAIVLALITFGAWLYAARDDGRAAMRRVAPGPTMIGDAKVELVRIFLPNEAVIRHGLERPAGTTDVAAEVSYDFTQAPEADSCLASLTAGEYSFSSASWATLEGSQGRCEPGMNGTRTYVFEVPDRLLSQVDGVGVVLLSYDYDFASVTRFQPPPYPTYSTVLPGRIG